MTQAAQGWLISSDQDRIQRLHFKGSRGVVGRWKVGVEGEREKERVREREREL